MEGPTFFGQLTAKTMRCATSTAMCFANHHALAVLAEHRASQGWHWRSWGWHLCQAMVAVYLRSLVDRLYINKIIKCLSFLSLIEVIHIYQILWNKTLNKKSIHIETPPTSIWSSFIDGMIFLKSSSKCVGLHHPKNLTGARTDPLKGICFFPGIFWSQDLYPVKPALVGGCVFSLPEKY